MTDLRKAAEMALEALDAHADFGINADKAREALRQALAESANSTTNLVEPKASSQTEQEWVGLTRDEVYVCWKSGDVVAAVEAKLKEKNGG